MLWKGGNTELGNELSFNCYDTAEALENIFLC